MLKLAGEFIEGQLADHKAVLDAHTRDLYQILRTGDQYHKFMPKSTHAPATLAANTLYGTPFVVPRALTIDRIGIHVTTAGAAGTGLRIGIHNNGTNLHPGSLLLDAGIVAADTTGVKIITINQSLAKGIYHFAVLSDGAPSVGAFLPAANLLGINFGSYDWEHAVWRATQAYGALPDPFTTASLILLSYPMVVVRIASLD